MLSVLGQSFITNVTDRHVTREEVGELSQVTVQRLRRAFVARFGPALAEDILAETIAWSWEHRDRVAAAENPIGLLYRVGQSKSRRFFRWRRRIDMPAHPGTHQLLPEPRLGVSLRALSESQRVAVVLVHAYQWTYLEVGETLGCSEAAVTNHVHRGLAKLRIALGVTDDDH
jgi:DNA-directed RNA polymerase specialized sigma24 family protein